jgi:hypothetical protein
VNLTAQTCSNKIKQNNIKKEQVKEENFDKKAMPHTSLLKGGYLPRPGVAFAAAETISTRTRCT